jgi:hypothetical protein
VPYTGVRNYSEVFERALRIPILSKEGKARSARVVCSKSRSHVIHAREALLIDRYCSSLNRYLMFRPIGLTLRAAPALAARGHPRLT